MGVTVRYDEFADNIKVSGLDGFGPLLTDAAVTRLRLAMGQRFRLYCAKEFAQDVIDDTAHLNRFHPVRDWLSALQWDGVPRVDKWLVTYAQANDDAYVRAVGKLVLVAAVRRVFQPGCKFDEMLLLEQEQQGFNRSSALAILATRQEWFSDYLPLNASGKEVIENTRGKWIMEAAELVGMKRADVQQVKGFLSRRVDRARVAYGRIATDVARQFIVIGTTNQQDYLRDDTGNRRIWPVHTERFDLEALQRDVDQLWAEAAVMEKAGASIRLDPALWPKAAEEQAARTPDDPWREKIEITLGDYKRAKVTKETVWTILDVPTRDQGQQQAARLNRAMQLAGWHKPNAQGKIKVAGKVVPGWVRGKAGKGIVTLAATRTRDGLRVFDYATVQSMIEAAIANERRMLCESLGEEVGRLLAEERREAMRATRDELHMLKLEIAKLATESATLREALANERCRVAGVEPLTRRMN
jgi:predicted P-loop ATPase